MRTWSPKLLQTVVQHFSHGAGNCFDPATEIGCQRESYQDLGFGWMYWALARVLQPRKLLVIGSGRGFSVACLALAVEQFPGAEVLLVDPGYQSWSVDEAQDIAAGLWQSPQAVSHFTEHLGLDNVRLLRLRSDEAFARFQSAGDTFDLILVDGEHSYRQALTDFRQASRCLNPGGLIVAHDTCCETWPGVALALETLALEEPWLERFSLSCYPGLAVFRKRQPLVEIRPVTWKENELINVWRTASGVTARPLPNGDDPRPGVPRADPREGLFGIFERGALIGGFGIYQRAFDADGADNFRPEGGSPLHGPLRYGAVLRPDLRGQRRWQLVTCETLRWFPASGFYSITRHVHRCADVPYRFERVGVCGDYTALRCRLVQPALEHVERPGLAEHSWRMAAQAFAEELQEERRERQEERRERQRVTAALEAVLHSTSWRWTRAARHLGAWARTLKRKMLGTTRRAG